MSAQTARIFEDKAPRPVRGRNAAAARTLITFPEAESSTLSIRAKALVFNDPLSANLLEHVERIARSSANALIIGETGTGKELVARHIHACSGREGPFVAVNCGAFSEQLVEAELFGHEAGAYTGAQQARAGWFETAKGGTLFLDEIGDLPLAMQVKLLRVLQERHVIRLGSRTAIPVDVRLVAATNVDLEEAVLAGNFRADLFYRLNVASIELPPLRERRGDILPLAEYFAERFRRKLGLNSLELSEEAVQALVEYDWPGNIRELENIIHFALIVCRNGRVLREDLKLRSAAFVRDATAGVQGSEETGALLERALNRLLDRGEGNLIDEVERTLVTIALARNEGNQVRSALALGITRNSLRTLLNRYDLR